MTKITTPLVVGQPVDQDGPVFREPWQASAFALAVSLSQAGHFGWPEWVECFSNHIKASDAAYKARNEVDGRRNYYHVWFAALEHLLESKRLLEHKSIDDRFQHLKANPMPHDHVAKREPVCVA